MLTAKAAFRADKLKEETVSDVLAAVLAHEPDWEALPGNTPSAVYRLLRRSLMKESRVRLHDVADLRIEVEEALSEPPSNRLVSGKISSPNLLTRHPILSLAAAIVAGAVIGGIVLWNHVPSPVSDIVRTQIALDQGLTLTSGKYLGRPTRTTLALSPEGRYLVYSAAPGGSEASEDAQLYLRSLDRFESIPIPGTEGGIIPFFFS
jgi:hypothetical protein